MKRFATVGLVLSLAATMLVGCSECYEKMQKKQDQIQVTCVPEVLTLKGSNVTAEQPTPDMEELDLTSPDSALAERIANLEIVPNSAHLGDSNHVMRLGGDCPPLAESTAISKSRGTLLLGNQRREEETIPAYVVLVNGELLPDSMNYLATLSLNKIREYFLSRGEVVEDFDYRAVKDEKERQKYGDIAKGKNGIVELRIKTKPVQDSLFVK